MIKPLIKILLIVFELFGVQNLYAQTIKGQIHDLNDKFNLHGIEIISIDASQYTLIATTSNSNGEFQLSLTNEVKCIIIRGGTLYSEYSEVKIENLESIQNTDTFDLGSIPLVKGPNFLQVQFKGISKRQEQKYQRKLIRGYNNKVKEYKDLEIAQPLGSFIMKQKSEKQKNSKRLKLTYVINLNDLRNKKTKP